MRLHMSVFFCNFAPANKQSTNMKRACIFIAWGMLVTSAMMAQQKDPISVGLGGVATIAGENHSPEFVKDSVTADSAATQTVVLPIPEWKKKLYYGYNFDIYYHHDSRSTRKENGWSISVEPEIGWKLKERIYLGLRLGGSYQDTYTTYISEALDGSKEEQNLRVRQGSWEVTPYMRYRMKTLFDGKVGIWMEAHVYTGMQFPRVTDGTVSGTDYDGLKQSITYGFQLSPVITYRFNKKSTFQVFFSILSLGYSGSTFFYVDPESGARYKEYTNDVIIFSGKPKNMLANQFTPGLYGLKFGVQKNF